MRVRLIGPVGARIAPADEPPPAAPAPLLVQAAIDQDPVEPRRELRLPRERAGRFVEADERFLRAIPGVLAIAQHRPGDPVGPLLVALHQEIEGSRFSLGDRTAQLFIARLHGRLSP